MARSEASNRSNCRAVEYCCPPAPPFWCAPNSLTQCLCLYPRVPCVKKGLARLPRNLTGRLSSDDHADRGCRFTGPPGEARHGIQQALGALPQTHVASHELPNAAPPNSISRQLPKPPPTARASRALLRKQTLIWLGAGGGEVSRAVGLSADRLRSTRPQHTAIRHLLSP
jgi:hypothetical protein